MPSTYAHYRFGVAMLASMPADIRRTVKRFRQFYDVGLHGPDIFFYYNPVMKTKTGSLSSRFHRQTGAEFFGRVCRGLRLEPSEAATAYLYGLLTHYCLDSVCHPLVWDQDAKGTASHKEIETEFDRYLLELDGKTPPCTQDLSLHIQLTPGECETAARFYPGATAAHIRDSVRNMSLTVKLLASPEGPRRQLMAKAMGLANQRLEAMVMTPSPNPRCAQLDEDLLSLYQKAAALFPVLLMQLNAHLTYNAPLGDEFAPAFG